VSPSKVFVVDGGPFAGVPGSDFGASVAFDNDLAVASSPGSNASSVVTYVLESGRWVSAANLSFQYNQEIGQTSFGWSIDMLSSNLLVGAPGVFSVGTITASGAAYFYEFRKSTNDWQQIGSTLRGLEDSISVSEKFGNAVALSRNRRVVWASRLVSLDGPTTHHIGFKWTVWVVSCN
jgi:hypothetical protein